MTRLQLFATIPAAALAFCLAVPAPAQTTREQGVSHPDAVTVAEMNPAPAPAPTPVVTKPSAAALAAPMDDPDAGVVTYVPSAPNELPIGTTIKVRMNQTVSTKNTPTGTPFVAVIEDAIERDGKVIVPAGRRCPRRCALLWPLLPAPERRIHSAAGWHPLCDPRAGDRY